MKKSYTVEIRRHALKGSGNQKDLLSPEGYEQARQVGMGMRGKSFTHIVVSPYFRTAQTAAAMAEGAGDFTSAKLTISNALFTDRMDEWMAYHKEFGVIVNPDESGLIEEEAGRMASDLKSLVESLPDQSRVLCVGHTPFVETLIYGLTGKVIDPLAECEGVEIEAEIDSENFFTKHHHELRL